MIIYRSFFQFYEKFKTIITSESNSLYALYSDSITRNPIFKWTKRPPAQIADIPELYCLLRNFIPTDLTYPFKAAKINKNTTKKLLLKFIFDLHKEIYEKIWKERATKWKQYKKDHDINKKSFINYRRNRRRDSHQQSNNTTQRNPNIHNGFHCPLNDTRRLLDTNHLWIYLTSSNFLHNLPWLSSLNEDLSQHHSNIYKELFLFHI
ncbi:hypothetical protein RhiirA4_453093 [Rhizophagus irregularis]|uniref:Uncharacterized protein n=1 Tax=Rhizophagus irregularis TaxID=588596 RepID=A0A2I1FZP1_9GLOM|nr:hypothetical protein RhiirA4_453093 [Rhizophagus irregularis]